MKNKTIILILVVLVAVFAVLIGVYFAKQNKPLISFPGDSAQQTPEDVQAGNIENNQTPATNQEKAKDGSAINNQTNTEQNKIVTENFSVNIPAGWKQTAAAMGVSAMAVNA
ncbi:MAG: hypothetical protein QMD86_02445 [Patescibacteria group bacterium]|nr:hypothetical protein [Patescibacteria group bacterium]